MPVDDISPSSRDSAEKLNEALIRLARLEERQSADKEAKELAAIEINRRLAMMNEIREQINSERGKYQEREQADERHALLISAIASMEARQTRIEAGQLANRRANGYLVGGATIVIGVVVLIANLLT